MPAFLTAIVSTLHILSCVALTVSILLQSGKGGGLAGAFGGGGSSQTLFGGRGAASFLSRTSTVLAVVFFLTSLTLGLAQTRGTSTSRSLIQEEARQRASQRTGTTSQTGTPGAAPQQAPQAPAGGGTATTPAPTGAESPAPATPAPGGGR